MSYMEIAVCDDNTSFLRTIEVQLKTLSLVENVYLFSDLNSFLFSIDGGKRYDAVLMDIEWDQGFTGLDAAKELYKLCPETKIIYITGYVEQFSQQIFLHRANLSGYLVKPVNMELLRANLQKVADTLPFEEIPPLILRKRGAPFPIPFREICFIESRGHTIHVRLGKETVTAYERLESILSALPAGFHQCHKSFIVNLSQIRRFLSGGVLMKNGECVPVSRARYAETKEAYFHFMGQKL